MLLYHLQITDLWFEHQGKVLMGIFDIFRKKSKSRDLHVSEEMIDFSLEESDQFVPDLNSHVEATSNEPSAYRELFEEAKESETIPPEKWTLYVYQNEFDTSAIEVPPTEAVPIVAPPSQSKPPLPQLEDEYEEDEEIITHVFREEQQKKVSGVNSERAIGPVYVPSLLETASLYLKWLSTQANAAPLDQTLSMWEAYLEICPDDVDARISHGWVIFDLYGFESAIHYFQQVLQEVSDQTPILIALGNLSRRAGDYTVAAQYFTKVNELMPKDVRILRILSTLQREAGLDQASDETNQMIDELNQGVWRGPA